MNIKWRTHELILVTVTFIGFNLIYLGNYLGPQQRVINRQLADIFTRHQLLFSQFRNQIVPEVGLALLGYLAYLWVNLSVIPWLQPKSDKKPIGRTKKAVTFLVVLTGLAFVFSAAFLGAVYLQEEWRYHYPGFSLFFKGQNRRDNIDLSGVSAIAFTVAVFLTYAYLREALISYLEKPGTYRTYRILITNQLTLFIGIYLLGLLLVQFLLKLPLFDLITRLNIIPLSPLLMGFAAIYHLFPTYPSQSLFHKPLLQRLALWSLLLTLPISFLIPGSPLLISSLAWLFQILVSIPVAWLVYQQQKEPIQAFRGLEKDLSKSKADLQSLRSQINPHFLFNTLNTIYASALDENATRTATCLQRLGDMMRFMLDENQSDFIPLQKEINYVDNYVALQRLRLPVSDKIVIEFNLTLDGQPHQIAPMLLIPLVENAFKHGISLQEPSPIRINLTVSKGQLKLEVHNRVYSLRSTDTARSQSGIGLSNLRDRLGLLYPNKHRFTAGQSGEHYTAQLAIQL